MTNRKQNKWQEDAQREEDIKGEREKGEKNRKEKKEKKTTTKNREEEDTSRMQNKFFFNKEEVDKWNNRNSVMFASLQQ